MAHPRLREILHCVALFGYGAVWRHFNGVTPLVREVMARELGVAEGLQNLVADDLHNPEDT
jgi:hypothetical protein